MLSHRVKPNCLAPRPRGQCWCLVLVLLLIVRYIDGFVVPIVNNARNGLTQHRENAKPLPVSLGADQDIGASSRAPRKKRSFGYPSSTTAAHETTTRTFRGGPSPLRKSRKTVVTGSSTARLTNPEDVERRLSLAVESVRLYVAQLHSNDNDAPPPLPHSRMFPNVRSCNAALAAFGDADDLLRGLRMFGRMRKLEALYERLRRRHPAAAANLVIPAPTLVTYSTLMSRAIRARKPRVALRLWHLMGANITPDVKAANILMNCFAKLADIDRAKALLQEMQLDVGWEITSGAYKPYFMGQNFLRSRSHRISPNLVTINTFLNACQKAGDLDSAMEVKNKLEEWEIRPDTRTYTTLIATVARKASVSSGENDPSLAFSLLQEMNRQEIYPNGMTYSALIDVCGRCQRSDLALQGLRIMIRQKTKNGKYLPMANEVGAWTAAIDACGKAGRVETAMKLFNAMSNYGCDPSTWTCGSLMDSLLRAGRTAETLSVLRYMKDKGIEPSEVMYTSLMTRAELLVQMENNLDMKGKENDPMASTETSDTRAIDVYSELMHSLMDRQTNSKKARKFSRRGGISEDADDNTLLLKVFLVFQQMKVSGAAPDIACFNALLRACARAGEFDRGLEVMKELQAAGLDPNDKSWRELLKAASRAKRSDWARAVWSQAVAYNRKGRLGDEPQSQWSPSVASFAELLLAHMRESKSLTDESVANQFKLLDLVIKYYYAVLKGEKLLKLSRVDVNDMLENKRVMLIVLEAAVKLYDMCEYDDADDFVGDPSKKMMEVKSVATAIVQLEAFKEIKSQRLPRLAFQALERAERWLS